MKVFAMGIENSINIKTKNVDLGKFLLIGNPNTGKTTLFNSLTKSSEHVGNWHGVTVAEKEKIFTVKNSSGILVDLPGLYSLTPLSFEEEVASDYFAKNIDKTVINICDINNLKRNLFLTLQLMEVTDKIVLFINTFKNKKKNIKKIKATEKILNKLKIKYYIGDASNKKDINQFKKILQKNIYSKTTCEFDYFNKNDFNLIKSIIFNNCAECGYKAEYAVIRLLENDEKIKEKIKLNKQQQEIIEKNTKNNFILLNKKRFDYIDKLFCEENNQNVYGYSKLDKIFLNKYFAVPIFIGILLLIFYLTFFSLGATLSSLMRDLIQNVIGGEIVGWLRGVCDIAWVVDLVETGIIGGVGTLLSFLPQVILLFFFLSLIEDSGYLARIAFLFEDIFAKIGLSGKSVYSLLMGFGCSTTAALTARNMEDKNAKIKTALLTPYMSCSAKLPIYAVIGGAFFGATNVFVIFGLYLLGVVVAILLSLVLEQKTLKSKAQSFILEFPAYRFPSIFRIMKILWENVKLFLIRIGTVIFSLNIIVWILQSFSFSFKFVPVSADSVSMLQSIGGVIAPIFAPLGFGNWGATSALIAGLTAKEIIVSSIAMFNGVDVLGDSMKTQTMRSITNPASVVFFTPASAISFMVFCLLYSPCLATISVFRKEIGRKWTILSIIIQFAIAYVLALISYNLFRAVGVFGTWNTIWIAIALFLIVLCLIYIFDKIKHKKMCAYCKGECKKCHKI